MGIHGRQPGRPEHLLDVQAVGENCVSGAIDAGKPASCAVLRLHGHKGAGGGDDEQGNLLDQDPGQRLGRVQRIGLVLLAEERQRDAFQRPVIPKHENAGQVMICGLAVRPRAKSAQTRRYRLSFGCSAYQR